jgi:hypothetical protein
MALNVDIDELRARLEGMWQNTPPSSSAGSTASNSGRCTPACTSAPGSPTAEGPADSMASVASSSASSRSRRSVRFADEVQELGPASLGSRAASAPASAPARHGSGAAARGPEEKFAKLRTHLEALWAHAGDAPEPAAAAARTSSLTQALAAAVADGCGGAAPRACAVAT